MIFTVGRDHIYVAVIVHISYRKSYRRITNRVLQGGITRHD